MKRNPVVYLSVPVSVNWKHAQELMSKYEEILDFDFWVRGTSYDEKASIKNADAFAFFTAHNDFRTYVSHLSPGVRKELLKAISKEKKIFMIYRRTTDDVISIYNCSITQQSNGNHTISGLERLIIQSDFEKYGLRWDTVLPKITVKKEETIDLFTPDNRILLSLIQF